MSVKIDQDPRALLRPIDYSWRSSEDVRLREEFEQTLIQSLEGIGACVIKNLPFAPVIREAALVRRRLFALSEAQKKQYTAERLSLMRPGYLPVYIEQYGDLDTQGRELWSFMRVQENLKKDFDHYTRANVFPTELPDCERVYPGYLDALERVSFAILETVARHYGQDADFFIPMLRNGSRICRLAHYPRPIRPQEGPRIVPHRDFAFLTLIVNIEGPGLELAAHGLKRWLPVEPGPLEIFVLAGEMLEYAANNRILAGLHRVSGERGLERSRYSSPCFFTGNGAGPIRRFETGVDNSYLREDPRIAVMTPLEFFEHRAEGFREAHTERFNAWPLI